MELSESAVEQYVGIASHVEKMMHECFLKIVAEKQHFCKERRSEWKQKGKSVTKRGVITSGRILIVPYLPQQLARNGRIYTLR